MWMNEDNNETGHAGIKNKMIDRSMVILSRRSLSVNDAKRLMTEMREKGLRSEKSERAVRTRPAFLLPDPPSSAGPVDVELRLAPSN